MNRSLSIICLIFLFSLQSYGQKTVSTKSGQQVEVSDIGTFKIVVDTLDQNQPDAGYQQVASYLKNLEAEKVAESVRLEQQQFNLGFGISKAKNEKNSAEEKKTKAEMEQLKARNGKVNSELKSIAKDLLMFRQLCKETEKQDVVKKYAKKYGITLLQGVEYTPKEIVSDPETIPQEQILNQESSIAEKNNRVTTDTSTPVPIMSTEGESRIEKINALIERQNSKKDGEEDCNFIFNGKDIASGKRLTQTKFSHFFGYTSKRLENYFKAQEYLTCTASIEKLAGDYFINLELRFKSKDVKKSYGKIKAGDFMKVLFVNGLSIFLKATEDSEAFIEQYTGNTIYKVKYKFKDKEDFSSSSRHYLDTVGLMWSSGFEEYVIYQVDYLQNQVFCIEHAD